MKNAVRWINLWLIFELKNLQKCQEARGLAGQSLEVNLQICSLLYSSASSCFPLQLEGKKRRVSTSLHVQFFSSELVVEETLWCCWRQFLFLVCTNIWVPGNEFSMPRFVYAFAARVRARAERVAVLHSKRKHVHNYSLHSKHLTRTQFCTRTNITHIVIPLNLCNYTLFSKSEDHLALQLVHLRTRTIVTQRTRYISSRESRTSAHVLLSKVFSFQFHSEMYEREEKHTNITLEGEMMPNIIENTGARIWTSPIRGLITNTGRFCETGVLRGINS